MNIQSEVQLESYLRQIPFIKLTTEFDFEKIKQEVFALDRWHNYWPPYLAKSAELDARHQNYFHSAITIVNPLARSSIVREHFAWYTNPEQTEVQKYYDVPAENRKWYKTEIYHKFPALMEFVLSISDRPILLKIVKTLGEHTLGWHSHQNDPLLKYGSPEQAILHIPIVTNPEVAHIVKMDMPEDRHTFDTLQNYKNDPRTFVENFTTGNVWFFNGYYPHGYKNYSNQERIDILLYNDLDWNPTLRRVMTEQVSLYNGQLIDVVM